MVPSEADILIAGVCAAFDADEERSITILSKLNIGKPLYVIGCMVAVRPDKMPDKAHLFYSWEYKKLFVELVPEPVVDWGDIELPTEFRCREDYRIYDTTKHFVGICTGCAFECFYCPHKIGAGNLVSRRMDEILIQIHKLLSNGVKTIVLTGIDTASYGKDIGTSFPELMENILTLTGNHSINYHIAQFNPEGIDERMVQCCSNPHITDLQLPIQTTSPRLLKIMNRNYKIDDVTNFIKYVRDKNSNLFLRTDIMVGFPTESSVEFSDTVEYAASKFNEVAVYRYESKDCTPIEKLELPLCSPSVVDYRMEQAGKYLKWIGCLFHFGGQDTTSLLLSDKKKYKMRGVNNAK